MTRPLRALIVEDNEHDAQLLVRELRRGGYDLTFTQVQTPEEMTAALVNQTWDIVLSDFSMPRFSAPEALAVVKRLWLDLPFIIVSGTIGEEAAVAALRAGANDFLTKGKLARLLPAIERELRESAGRAQRHAIEQQLRQAQKMESLGQLTGGIAHDFNNLLAVIVSNIEVLIDSLQEDPDRLELAKDVLASALRGAELTQRLLTVARRQPLSPRLVQLNERVPQIIGMLQRTLGEHLTIAAALDSRLWTTRIDASQVDDALLNLAINARDAMPEGGNLTIATANVALDETYAALHPGVVPGAYVALSVADTGVGMPPDVIERAMEPFFTTKEPGKGTGLGLSMVYCFARQSDGHIDIVSQVGRGTKITLYLPRATGDRSDAESHAGSGAEVKPRGHETVLAVDDETGLLRVTMRQLAKLGFAVRGVDSSDDAVLALASGERFDLLFTDVGLPGGITGYDLAATARQHQPWMKVLFTTGYAIPQPQTGGEPPEPLHIIQKPYRYHELAAKVRAVLDASTCSTLHLSA